MAQHLQESYTTSLNKKELITCRTLINAGAVLCTIDVYQHIGGPRIQGTIQFQLASEVDAATPVFTLTCTSTGGPFTTVSWQRNGVVVSGGTTEVTDLATATYTSTLTVTGRKTGNYCCVVANSRSTVISPMLPVQGEYYLYLLYFAYYNIESDRAEMHTIIIC